MHVPDVLHKVDGWIDARLTTTRELPVVGFPLRRQWQPVLAREKRLGPVDEAFVRFEDGGHWKEMIGRPLSTD